jgi:gamma-glutamyltranspeptidase / glutathione hydrolase
VTIPFVAGPGGGGFMVIYNARTHRVTTVDGREACPSACTPSMFINPSTGQPMDYTQASDQPRSTGVPSMVATRVKALFQYLEASRLAYADRNHYVGDPDYVKVPLGGLLDPAFAATRRCLIGNSALSSPVAPGLPFPPYNGCSGGASATSSASPEAHHTNNIVAVDRWGDIVAYTNTINFFGGSGQVVPGYGFLLNDEMTDFDFVPPSPGAYDPNLPAGWPP